MNNLWIRVEMEKEDIVVVDCGYVSEQKSRDRADQIFALGVGKCNLTWGVTTGPDQRIHIYIPPSKVGKVISALPIVNKKTWFGATHSFASKRGVNDQARATNPKGDR